MADTNANCDSCAVHNKSNLERLGVQMENYDFLIALAGNPNTGKSTVFNYLTGLRQHTGNWPGKTVTRAEGGFSYNEKTYKLIDLPGTYSLLSTSTDEEVARDFILFGKPDVTLVVVDATRIERNLNLTLQILEITDRVVVCVNLIDEAERNGIHINTDFLSKKLGVPVVGTAARQGVGMDQLLKVVADVASSKVKCSPHRISTHTPEIKTAIERISQKIVSVFPGLPNSRWVALRLLEGDQRIIEAVKSGELGTLINGTDSAV